MDAKVDDIIEPVQRKSEDLSDLSIAQSRASSFLQQIFLRLETSFYKCVKMELEHSSDFPQVDLLDLSLLSEALEFDQDSSGVVLK